MKPNDLQTEHKQQQMKRNMTDDFYQQRMSKYLLSPGRVLREVDIYLFKFFLFVIWITWIGSVSLFKDSEAKGKLDYSIANA